MANVFFFFQFTVFSYINLHFFIPKAVHRCFNLGDDLKGETGLERSVKKIHLRKEGWGPNSVEDMCLTF